MPGKHAVLSCSASNRWLNCPGSIKLSEQYPVEEGSVYAQEGTLAHGMAERLINETPLKEDETAEIARFYADNPELGGSYDEMGLTLRPYYDFVRGEFERARKTDKGAVLMTEQRLDLEPYIPGGFGTSDVVIIADGTMQIIDLKYGKGVKVDAKNNPQLRLYALGALNAFDLLYDINLVRMTIYQPRLDHISSDDLSVEYLEQWGHDVVAPTAKQALSAEAPFHAGSWCKFCPAKGGCVKRSDKNLEMQRYKDKMTLSDSELAEILGRVDELTQWAADIKDDALKKLMAGGSIPGWKVVEGRSIRKYSRNEDTIVSVAESAGYDRAMLYESKLLSVSAMEKMMGKKKFKDTLGECVEKPAGKPTLAPGTDKRQAINSASNDFDAVTE